MEGVKDFGKNVFGGLKDLTQGMFSSVPDGYKLVKIGEDGTKTKENPPNLNLANNQSDSRSDTIDSVSDFTTYEGSDEGDEILLAPSPSGGGTTQSGNQVVEKIVKVPVDTSDPYEVLYKG